MSRVLLFRIGAVVLGALLALLLAEVLVRLVLPDPAAGFLVYEGYFSTSDIPGLPFLPVGGESGVYSRDGLRAPLDPTPAPAPGHRRILLVGDSVAAALNIDRSKLLTSVAEEALNEGGHGPVEVYNWSMPGVSLRQELAWVRARGLGYSPDLVVFLYVINDPIETPILDRENFIPSHSRLLSLLRRAQAARYMGGQADWYEPEGEPFRELVRTFDDVAELAATQPTAVAIMPLLTDDRDRQVHLQPVTRLCEERGIPVLDLVTPLDGAFRDEHREDGGSGFDLVHLSRAGHRLVGLTLADALVETGLVP